MVKVLIFLLYFLFLTICIRIAYLRTAHDRIPVGARFSTRLQTTTGGHPSSYAMGTFEGQHDRGVTLTAQHIYSADIKENIIDIPVPPPVHSWQIIG
jgi:hypothetical protein